MRLSMAAENYLLSIYQLEELGRRVTPSQLAEQLKRLPEGEGAGNVAAVGHGYAPAANARRAHRDG